MGTHPSSRTAAQNAAASINAQSSTGPRTEAGKAASRNSFKHGFTCVSMTTLGDYNNGVLAEVVNEYERELCPAGYLEADLVRRIADENFRTRLIEGDIDRLRLQGMAAARKSDPPSGSTGSREDAFVAATANPAFQRRLDHLLRYKAASERAFYRALNTLRQIQKERRAEEARELQRQRKQQLTGAHGFVSQTSESDAPPPVPPR